MYYEVHMPFDHIHLNASNMSFVRTHRRPGAERGIRPEDALRPTQT